MKIDITPMGKCKKCGAVITYYQISVGLAYSPKPNVFVHTDGNCKKRA